MTFDEFIEVLFNHPQQLEYLNVVPLEIIEFYIQLFNSPCFLFDKFSAEQLEQGFWELQNVAIDFSVGFLLADKTLPLQLRMNCITAMYNLYREFFSIHKLEEAGGMWWDGVITAYKLSACPELPNDDVTLRNVLFETLTRILQDDSLEYSGAALHGMGHLRHPSTENIILAYLEAHPHLDTDTVDYALNCITGNIM
jgi:hypothetical protein